MAPAASEQRSMEYLSVYDIVWINSTLAGKALPFDYIPLEEAMASQYSYGVSKDVPRQAANLLHTLVVKSPFAYGNMRTAFIATAAFLSANGYSIRVDDLRCAEIVSAVRNGRLDAVQAIDEMARSSDDALKPGVSLRSLVSRIFNSHAEALRALAPEDE